jgi:uncharacterized protein YcbK (DUF882 family)
MVFTEDTWPKDRWPNFSFKEMACQHSGICDIDESFMDKLQELRNRIGFGLVVSSGYRDKTHPIEAEKISKSGNGGAHTTGKAVDLKVARESAYNVLKHAMALEFTGIGVAQTGEARFLHLDDIQPEDNFHVPRPTIWSY